MLFRSSFLPGRPEVKSIIRSTAETALGEMAVVVCGPPGLVQSTRNAAARVSDERAVHKGTGAQGIYVHAEAFGYEYEVHELPTNCLRRCAQTPPLHDTESEPSFNIT